MPAPPNASEQLICAYREHLAHVRGFAASTIARHGVIAGDFLRLLKCDDDIQHLPQVQARDLETFVVHASARVGRITMQKVIAIMRSFLRFLAASGKIPVGLDRHLDSPRHHRGERLARALHWEDTLVKDINTKLVGSATSTVNPQAPFAKAGAPVQQHVLKLRAAMDSFAKNELGPIDADRAIRETHRRRGLARRRQAAPEPAGRRFEIVVSMQIRLSPYGAATTRV